MCTDAFGLSLLWVLQWLMFPLVSNQDQATLQRNHEKGLNRPKQELELTLNWAAYQGPYKWNPETAQKCEEKQELLPSSSCKKKWQQPVHGERICCAYQAGISFVSSTREHWRRGFLGSTEQVFQNPCTGTHSGVLSLQTGKEFLFAFLKQSVHVLSCVRPVAPIFQHDLFFFHCLGATLAEQMNQTMLLNQSRANTISKYYPIAWFWANSLSAWPIALHTAAVRFWAISVRSRRISL